MVSTMATEPGDTTVYPIAIVLPVLSFLVVILVFPALLQHYSNRNIGATALMLAAMYSNFQNFLNAIIWPNDDMADWYNGVGLCDVEAKLQIAMQTLFPASVACILRALANVMDTNSSSWTQTNAQKRRGFAIDLVCCVVLPALQMLFHWIVQPNRYYIFGVAGCNASNDGSWLALVLLQLPPFLWTIVDTYYSVLILIRLIRYRFTFSTILAHSNTTKSRFLRLYILCCITSGCLIPLEGLVLYYNGVGHPLPFKWSVTHPTDGSWNTAILVRSNGSVFYDRIIWLVGGFVVFLLFGFGGDAVKLYKAALLSLGFGRLFPTLKPGFQRSASSSTSFSELGSKAKMLFSSFKDSKKVSTTSSTGSISTASTTSPDPKRVPTFSETASESQSKVSRSHWGSLLRAPSRHRYHGNKPTQSFWSSFLTRKVATPRNNNNNNNYEDKFFILSTMPSHSTSQDSSA